MTQINHRGTDNWVTQPQIETLGKRRKFTDIRCKMTIVTLIIDLRNNKSALGFRTQCIIVTLEGKINTLVNGKWFNTIRDFDLGS